MHRDLSSAALDALSAFVFVVDAGVSVIHSNAAARRLGEGRFRRAGELLHCIHSVEAPGGCGAAPACAACPIRLSVAKCLDTQKPLRTRFRFQNLEGHDSFVLLTASPFEHEGSPLVALTLEDFDEILSLRRLVPICSHCRRVRSEANHWQHVEQYAAASLAVDWTHGICDECLKEHYRVGP